MGNILRQTILEAHNPPQPMAEGSFKRGDNLFWGKGGRFWLKTPNGTKVEITQGGYEDAMVLEDSNEAAEPIKLRDTDQSANDALDSLADTMSEIQSATNEPEPEVEQEPENAPEDESNPLRAMFPGIKSMTIQFHECSNPIRALFAEHKSPLRLRNQDSNPLRAMLC
jgi:hypothetical protein